MEIIKNLKKGDEIKLETNFKYYYKGMVKEINEEGIIIRDVRGIKTLIYLKDIDFIKVLPKGYKKRKIFNKQKFQENINHAGIRIHNENYERGVWMKLLKLMRDFLDEINKNPDINDNFKIELSKLIQKYSFSKPKSI